MKKTKIECLVSVFLWAFFCIECAQPISAFQLSSPDDRIRFTIELDEGQLNYSVAFEDSAIVGESPLGLVTDHGPLREFRILSAQESYVSEDWKPILGERSTIRDHYRSVTIQLRTVGEPQILINLNCRAYDEGIAFRYEFPEQADLEHLVIKSEQTEFSFTADHEVWATYRAQAEYEEMPLSKLDEGCERPLVLELGSSLYAAIGEASLVDYARMKFSPHPDKRLTLVSALAREVEASLPFVTPWRFLMVGESAGQLLENNFLIFNLNQPNQIEEAGWIKPGKVIREVTLTTQGGRACVDFAASHNLQYVEFDAGWYGPEHEDSSDAKTVAVDPKRSPGPLDLPEVIRYARERDIGIILYVNRRALERQLHEILPLFHEWGVSGVKYGFVQVGPQEWTSWLHEAVRKAASHELMVNIHDEYRPTGYSRTYPNLMTQEGIRGDKESPANSQTLITMFTRMIAGAGDNTICYFAKRVDQEMGSHASQLAKAVCL